MAHEIIERNETLDDVCLIGLKSGGTPFAQHLGDTLSQISGTPVTLCELDVSSYRDDLLGDHAVASLVEPHCDLTNKTAILVDDVLFTGRTIRAALNALAEWGRPKSVQLAVMVDRGHRELPIRPDFVGKNLPTARDEEISSTLDGVWIGTKGSAA
jgi:pyrimidine operon attenuation protein/uracil phosphoribosyltransferase